MLQDPNPTDPIELSAEEWEEIWWALHDKQIEYYTELVEDIKDKIGPLGQIAYHAGTQGAP